LQSLLPFSDFSFRFYVFLRNPTKFKSTDLLNQELELLSLKKNIS